MERTPYSYEFLWHQINYGYENIRKKKYRKLLDKFLTNDELKTKFNKVKDKKVRKYEGGKLEKVASVLGLALCMYDNYPEIDIDLLLTAIILYGFSSLYTKREFYEKIKDYPEVIPFIYRKKRKKPVLEILIFDDLLKIDDKITKYIQKRREKNG